MWYPTIINANDRPINGIAPISSTYNTIVAFTDGSYLPRTKQAGAGAFITLPYARGPINYSRSRGGLVPITAGHRMSYVVDMGNHHIVNVTPPNLEQYVIEHGKHGHQHIVSTHIPIPHGTSNIGELYAVGIAINAMTTFINRHVWYKDSPIIFAMDSKYSIGILDGGHKPRSNIAIITELHRRIQLLSNHGQRRITFRWVKAHVGIAGNEVADRLAGTASLSADINMSMPSLPPMIHVINDVKHYPPQYSTNDILGVYPKTFGAMDIERLLASTGRYITHITDIRPI